VRALLLWLLRQIVGPELARDIEGDVAERGEGAPQLAAVVLSTLLVTVQHAGVSLWLSLPGGRRSSHELRHALRSLSRSPWYSSAVIAVIALTGALATAGFALVDGVLFKPLPIPQPESLYATTGPRGAAMSLADLDAWRRAAPDAAMSLYGRDFIIGAMGVPRPRPIVAIAVEQTFFDVLGEHPVVGSWRSDDFTLGASRIRVMISDRLWRAIFSKRADIVGQALEIAGAQDYRRRPIGPFEVAGVLPEDFVAPVNRATPDVLLPMAVSADRHDSREEAGGRAIVRTRHADQKLEATLESAFGNGSIAFFFNDTGSKKFELTPIERYLGIWQRDDLASAFAACGVLMLLAILNVAALSVLRGQQQLHELGVRRALGATRLDLFRLALFDAAPLVAAGMALALFVTPWAIAVATSRLSQNVALLKTPDIDGRVMIFWAALAVVTTLAAAGVRTLAVQPATVAAATRRGQSSTARRGRFVAATIASQIALGFVITVAGTLVAGSLWRLWQEPIGFTMDHTWLIELSHTAKTPTERRAVMMSVIDHIKRTGGVEAVAPMDGGTFLTGAGFSEGFLTSSSVKPVSVDVWPVGAEYFGILNIPLRAGRVFTAEEVAASAPVVVLSESAARFLFPYGGAVGSTVNQYRGQIAVIGVVADVVTGEFGYKIRRHLYRPASLSDERVVVLVKSQGPLEPVLAVVATEPVGVLRAMPLMEALSRTNQRPILRAWLFGSFAIAALTIVAVGTFGLIAMSAARRTRELGIRTTLGATRESLVRLFVQEQVVTVSIGLVVGAGLSTLATRVIEAYLWKTPPRDPVLWSIAAIVLLLVAGTAALIPSLRASRIDPVQALRED
jgi:putative ABC transport system permease protein